MNGYVHMYEYIYTDIHMYYKYMYTYLHKCIYINMCV